MLQQQGARPRFAPSGDLVAFDRKNEDGYYDVYISALNGRIVRSVTAEAGRFPRNNGNPVFHPSGRFLVFISEESEHFLPRTKYLGDPGMGLFCNLWAIDLDTGRFTKLTNAPIKRSVATAFPPSPPSTRTSAATAVI